MNSFKDKNSQDSYLQSLIETVDIKRERKYNIDNPKMRLGIEMGFVKMLF